LKSVTGDWVKNSISFLKEFSKNFFNSFSNFFQPFFNLFQKLFFKKVKVLCKI